LDRLEASERNEASLEEQIAEQQDLLEDAMMVIEDMSENLEETIAMAIEEYAAAFDAAREEQLHDAFDAFEAQTDDLA
jgi:hypothetical protein